MNKKILIILGITILVILTGSFWFLQKDDGDVGVVENDVDKNSKQFINEEIQELQKDNQKNTLSKIEEMEILSSFADYLKQNSKSDFIFYKDKELDISFVNIYEDVYLYGNISFEGSYSNPYILAVNEEDGWNIVFWGQDHPSCNIIDKYKIPNEIYDVCFSDNAELRCASNSERCN
jgi:hypothetical protein